MKYGYPQNSDKINYIIIWQQKGTVSGVIANMVTLVVDGPVAQNEICYISTGGDRLMAEVIKVVGTQVYVQVFESTVD